MIMSPTHDCRFKAFFCSFEPNVNSVVLKNVVTCFLIFAVSLAFCYETIIFFSGETAEYAIACEEAGSEAEGSGEKNGKTAFSDDDYFSSKHLQHRLTSLQTDSGDTFAYHRNNFCSSDYSHEVYSPPEYSNS
jgi:hypothetical protein